jgi:hypothetical protein
MKRINILIIILLMFSFITIPVNAETTKDHEIIFYFDPNLVADMDFAKAVLPKYVEDMNRILEKTTNRRLIFNPETDIILVDSKPQTDSSSYLPDEGFEIWVHAVLSDLTFSYGGYGGIDKSGAGVLAGLHWLEIHDPDNLSESETKDYWIQINNMLHELAHVFKAGIGEYYNLTVVKDTTGFEPVLNIDFNDAEDSFWSNKKDFLYDPLFRIATQDANNETREDLLNYTQYSELTSAIISGNYRSNFPLIDFDNIVLNIYSNDGILLSEANVKIWQVKGCCSSESTLLIDEYTDSNGQLIFDWGGSSNPHNNYDFLRLIKVYKDGYESGVKYVSVFDADIEKIIYGKDILEINIELNQIEPIFTETATNTETSTETLVPTFTETPSPTFTSTPTFTQTNTITPTSTLTNTPTKTVTLSKTNKPTNTPTITRTKKVTPTPKIKKFKCEKKCFYLYKKLFCFYRIIKR